MDGLLVTIKGAKNCPGVDVKNLHLIRDMSKKEEESTYLNQSTIISSDK